MMTHAQQNPHRKALLTTVSVLALLGSAIADAVAADADRPLIWVDMGWQFEQEGGGQEVFDPAFVPSFTDNGFSSPARIENSLPWSYGANAAISYQPKTSDWIISASIRYGRTRGKKSFHQQTTAAAGPITAHLGPLQVHGTNSIERYEEAAASNTETHEIVDFQAGKEVGLGLLGTNSSSILSAGVRYARIRFNSQDKIIGDPDFSVWTNLKYPNHNHFYNATNIETRDFNGIGPVLSLNSSVPIAGNHSNGEISLDWGMNGGLLFGRQKSTGHHQTKTGYFHRQLFVSNGKYNSYHQTTVPHNRSRSVTVPNLGGFAGLSLKWTNAKISIGYRADIFFNALDGGIDAHKSENREFFGPYASISIGIGD